MIPALPAMPLVLLLHKGGPIKEPEAAVAVEPVA
jgi:hypothetical protein